MLTKVRKSAVYEQHPSANYEEDNLPSLPVAEITGKDVARKSLDFAQLIRENNDKPAISTASSNAYGSFNSMFKGFSGGSSGGGLGGASGLGGLHDDMPAYKEGSYEPQQTYGHNEPLAAAIKSMRTVEVKELQDDYQNAEPQVIDIAPSALPIVINFRTSASAIKIHQTHERGEPQEVQQTQSEDEPQFLKHQVTKPVIQEVHEIIMPYRKIIQEIRPVEEQIKTIVARGKERSGGAQGGGHSGGGGNDGGLYASDAQVGGINILGGGAGAAFLGGQGPNRIRNGKYGGFSQSKKQKY